MDKKTVGILGGLGPLSTVYFMDMIIKMTQAGADQEHLDMIVLNHATIPDRTAFIMGLSDENPALAMAKDANKLQDAGADYIVMPCNTAHFFYQQVKDAVSIPVLNIVEGAVKYSVNTLPGLKKIGVLATDGTIRTGTYSRACEKEGIECVVPDEDDQGRIMKLIYEGVKAGKSVDVDEFLSIIGRLSDRGCGAVMLGCTELSIIKRDYKIEAVNIIDSLEVLARDTILFGNKKLRQ